MKKFLKVFLVSAMAFSLFVGCSGSDESGDDDSTATAIKVGGSGPLTGEAAIYGTSVQNAAELAIEEINALGGLQFELNFQDDEADGEKATTAYGVLKDWGMQVSLFTVTSGSGAAVASSYAEDNIFAITPSGSSTSLIYSDSTRYSTCFQMCFTDPNQGVGAADYIAENFAGVTVGIIYKNDDVYSTGIYEKFIEEAEAVGLEIVCTMTFDDSSSTDFSSQIGECKAAGADLVFLPMYYENASSILMQSAAADYSPIFFGVDGMDGILTLDGFDTSYAEGVYLLTAFAADATDDKTVAFVAAYEAAYGETPNQFAADAYDAMYVIYEACTAAGVTADMTASEIADLLVEYITGDMTFDGVTGTNITWSDNGEVSKSAKVVQIVDGAYVSAE